jgi:sugar phosphate isomerase/epimerase
MRRRDFLCLSALAALSRPLLIPGRARQLSPIGLQLYTVRDLMHVSVPWTLEQVASVGYREVEFAGYFGIRPAQIRRWLDQDGLKAPAAHVGFDDLQNRLASALDAAAELGHRYLVLSSIPQEEHQNLDQYRRAAELLNRAGRQARERGLAVAYHNHDFEFRRIGNFLPYDVLLTETDPALVAMEIDLYWITKGGHDPIRYFEAHQGRFRLCHVKDMDRQGNMIEVGSGVIDFSRILARRGGAGLRHFFVEHDNPRTPLASIRTSYNYLRQLTD